MSDRPLRFPPRKHVITASVKIEDVPGVVARLRRELAQVLRDLAMRNTEPVRAALLEAADIFEEGTEAAERKPARGPTPIRSPGRRRESDE
jgi:hypothetical protein